jgi:hypothetical protein
MYADPVPGYKNGSYEGGYCPCHAWDMMGGWLHLGKICHHSITIPQNRERIIGKRN